MPLQLLGKTGKGNKSNSYCNASLFIDATATTMSTTKSFGLPDCNASLSADAFYLIISIKTAADKTLAVFKANYF